MRGIVAGEVARVDVDAARSARASRARPRTSRDRASRRRRDSQPSIHLPRDVNFPGTKIAGSGLTRFGLRREEIVARRDGAAADPGRGEVGEPRERRSIIVLSRVDLRSSWSSACSTHSSYGKSRVRLVQVTAPIGDRHDLRDLTVAVRFEGDYDASYTDGDNRDVLPTDTMKNTVYALAAQRAGSGARIVRPAPRAALSRSQPRLTRVTHRPRRASLGPHRARRARARPGVRRAGPETRTAVVTGDRDGTHESAPGIADLVIMKSAHSAFAGFPRDEYTTLPETRDRLLATSLTATGTTATSEIEFGPTWRAVRSTLLETFAEHAANRCSTRCTRWARRCSTRSTLSRASAW